MESQKRQLGAAAQAAAPLRVVVNCAGIAPPAKVLDREGNPAVLADFERVIRINLVGTFNVISQASAVIAKNELHDEERGVIETQENGSVVLKERLHTE